MRNLRIIVFIGLLFPLAGCEKILDVKSTRALSDGNMWNSLEDARAALFGVYALNRAALSDNNRHVIYGDVRLADFEPTSREDLKAIHNNALNADFKLINDLSDWRPFYATINAANLYLERIHEVYEKDPRFVEQTYNLDRAQVKALRAFSYFYMSRIWGDVPLILSSHEGSFENKPRDPQERVFAAIEQDLLEAEPKLPYAYDGYDPEQTGAYYGQDIGTYGYGYLVSKQGVWTMLAHMYAWKGDYANAAIYAQKIIDKTNKVTGSGAALAGTFRNTADEIRVPVRYIGYIWEANHTTVLFAARRGELATSGTIEELTAAQPIVPNRRVPAIYVPKDSLFSIYNEKGTDGRFYVDSITKQVKSFDGFFTGFDKPYPVFRKIFVPWDNYGIGKIADLGVFKSSTVFSRFAEMALLLAEAKAALNDKEGAITLLNLFRAHYSIALYVDEATSGSLIDAIFKERRRELMGEGWRWYDLVRYKKIRNNDQKFNQLIKSGGIYWPVSETLVNQNPMLTQYSYWK